MEDNEGAVKREEINTKLDGLFEQYLELVDEYDRLREDLTKTMSTVRMPLIRIFSLNSSISMLLDGLRLVIFDTRTDLSRVFFPSPKPISRTILIMDATVKTITMNA
jgi:hypothetical protein